MGKMGNKGGLMLDYLGSKRENGLDLAVLMDVRVLLLWLASRQRRYSGGTILDRCSMHTSIECS